MLNILKKSINFLLNIFNFFIKKFLFLSNLIDINFIVNFKKKWNFNSIFFNFSYFSFKTVFIFKKILNIIDFKKLKFNDKSNHINALKKINLLHMLKDINNFLFDLNTRFTNLSIKSLANIRNYLLKFNNKHLRFFSTKQSFLHYKSPTVAGIGNYTDVVISRNSQIIVGLFKYLPLNYTLSGYFVPYIVRQKKKFFFCKLNTFTNILSYYFFENKINNSYEKYKLYFIFFSKPINIYFKILFFSVKKKKINFFKYSNFLKQYNIFFLKNNDNSFFDFNWLISKKNINNARGYIENINLNKKHKHTIKGVRNLYNQTFSTKFRSYRLSKIFKNLSKINGNFIKKYINLELNLLYLLIRSNFAYNKNDSAWLIDNGFIFINSKLCKNKNHKTNKNDIIQMILYKNEFIHYRYIISTEVTRLCRMWTTLYRYFNIKSKPFKTQPTSKKSWLIKSLWNQTDIPKYLEVDFIIMTIIIIYNPISNKDIFPFFLSEIKFSIIKLYNWKYLH